MPHPSDRSKCAHNVDRFNKLTLSFQVDIHPTAIARDLLVLFSLHELSTIPSEEHKTHHRARELLVMLHYLYWATVMPPCAHATMVAMMEHVCDTLKPCTQGDIKPLDLSWLHIPEMSIEPLLHDIKWWLAEGLNYAPLSSMIQDKSVMIACTKYLLTGQEELALQLIWLTTTHFSLL